MIITLCGSARFEPWFHAWNKALTLAGHTVFSLACFPSIEGEREWYTPEQKAELDSAHLRKIDASDAVLVLNVAAYIGPSTLREIEHARRTETQLYFLESWGEGLGIGPNHSQEHRDKFRKYFERDGIAHWPASPVDTYRIGVANPWHPDLLGERGSLGRLAAIELQESMP